jgi:O-antigen ligase
MKKPRAQKASAALPSGGISLSVLLLSSAIVLAPFITGRLEVGSEPVEPSLRGLIVGLFTTGTMLSVAIWLMGLLVLIAAWWEWKHVRSQTDSLPSSIRLLTTLLLLWMLASVLTSVYRWGTLVIWSHWVVAVVAAWVLAKQRTAQATVALYAIALAGMLAAAVAVREYAENVRLVPNWRVFGTFFNPSFLAGYLCLTFPVTLSLALAAPDHPLTRGKVEMRWLAGFGTWLQAAAILLTGSRFGAISAALSLAAMAIWMSWNRSWSRQRARWFVAIALLCVVTAFLAARPLTQRITPQAAQAESHSGGFRVWTWKGTLSMVQHHPLLGTGLGTYEIAYPRDAYVGFTRLAHNSYLQLAAESGAPAAILLFAVLGTLAWTVLCREQALRHAPQHELNMHGYPVLRAGLASAVTAGLARNLVDSDWSIFACLFTFWGAIGLMTALLPRGVDEQATSRTAARWSAAPVLLLTAAVVLLTLRAGGTWNANLANWNLSQGMPDAEGYQRALRWEPFNGDHYLSLGMMYLGMARAGDPSMSQQAERALRRAAELTPISKTWYHLGNLYRDVLGDGDKAVDAYRRALELDPHALRVMVELGKTLEDQGKLQEAEAVYRRMLAIESSVYNQVRAVPEIPEVDYAFAYAGLARIARAQRKPESEVRPLYERALQILDADRAARQSNPMAQALPRPPERERALETLRQECERALR